MNNPLKKADTFFFPTLLLLAGCAGVVIWDQWHQWSTKEDYQFGYLVPFFFLYVLYDRWPQIRATLLGETPLPAPLPAPASRVWNGLVYAGLTFSILSFAGGAAWRALAGPGILSTWFNTFGFMGMFFGFAWLLCEKNAAGRTLGFGERMAFIGLVCFPGLVWFISGPFLYLVDTNIKLILLNRVTGAVVEIMSMLDMSVTQEGNVIILPTILANGRPDSVGVADACSGIRSLTACVFMGAFLSAIFVSGIVRKMMLIFFSVLFAIFLNVLRTSFLTLWAFKNTSASLDMDLWGNAQDSPEFVVATVHGVAGYVAMGVTFLLLVMLIPLINIRLSKTVA